MQATKAKTRVSHQLTIDGDDAGGRDSHEVTMMRRKAFSSWLENVVEKNVDEDLRKAQTNGNHIDEVDN